MGLFNKLASALGSKAKPAATAAPSDDAGSAAGGEDFADTIQRLRVGAENGNADDMMDLGDMYADGRGIAQDSAEAERWYVEAQRAYIARAAAAEERIAAFTGAENGNADDMFALGDMYASGRGVAKDEAEAVDWFRAAADKGHAGAMRELGMMYDLGLGVTQDLAEAVRWYRAAADNGHARGMCSLGGSYLAGRGVAQDVAEAVRWFRTAAENGDAVAMFNLGGSYAHGVGVTKDDAEAVRWFREAAAWGDEAAMAEIGRRGLPVAARSTQTVRSPQCDPDADAPAAPRRVPSPAGRPGGP